MAKPKKGLFQNLDPKKSAGGGGVIGTTSTADVIRDGGQGVIPTPTVDPEKRAEAAAANDDEIKQLEAEIAALEARMAKEQGERQPTEGGADWARAHRVIRRAMEGVRIPNSERAFIAWLGETPGAAEILGREAPQLAEALGIEADTPLPELLIDLMGDPDLREPSPALGRQLLDLGIPASELKLLAPELAPVIGSAISSWEQDQRERAERDLDEMRLVGQRRKQETRDQMLAVGAPMPAAKALNRKLAEQQLIANARRAGEL